MSLNFKEHRTAHNYVKMEIVQIYDFFQSFIEISIKTATKQCSRSTTVHWLRWLNTFL